MSSMRNRLERDLLSSFLGRALCLVAMLLPLGCLFPAPIEEEEPDPAFRPEIVIPDDVEPNPLSLVERDLETQPILPFAVLEITDANSFDNLYWRAVYDTGIRAVRLEDGELRPGARQLSTLFAPCSQVHRLFVEESRTAFGNFAFLTLYLAVSDVPFLDGDFNTLPPNAAEKQLQTELERPVTLVTWTIKLNGVCP